MKPSMSLTIRISVDSSQKQRYTEKEIISSLLKNNIKFNRNLLIRETDGAVMGELLNK